MEPEREHRIAYVDGLRAVAVLLVVAHHVARHAPHAPAQIPFLSFEHVMLDGSHGVDLFFVLSGFCLAYPFLRALREMGAAVFDLPRYFAKRIVRIVPPYYAALGLFTLAAFAMHRSVQPIEFLKQLFFLDWHTNFVNGSFWTLAVEFRWYFLFPLALLVWVKAWRAFLLVAVASTLVYAFTRLHAVDVGTLLPFLLGIVAADIAIRKIRIPWLPVVLAASFLLALVLEGSATMPSPDGPDTAWFFVQTNVGWHLTMFLAVVAAGTYGPIRRALALRVLAVTGAASYSVYLVHEPIVDFVQSHVALNGALAGIVAYAAAVAAGFVFWAIVERPLVGGALRRRAVAIIEPLAAKAIASLQIPRSIAANIPVAGPVVFAPSAVDVASAYAARMEPEELRFP